jgi:hypothetical protein
MISATNIYRIFPIDTSYSYLCSPTNERSLQMKRNERVTAHGHDDNHLELIRISEFAHRLGISIWTARSWAYAGKISSVKLGSLLQIPVSEVARMINENLRLRQ